MLTFTEALKITDIEMTDMKQQEMLQGFEHCIMHAVVSEKHVAFLILIYLVFRSCVLVIGYAFQ